MAQVETLTILQDVLTKNQPQPVLESELQAFHDFIVSQPDGVETLRLLGRNLPDSTVSIKAMSNDAGAFKSKTSGKGSLLNLWVYQRLTVDAYGKSFTANLGGFSPGFPAGALFGDLYYNDPNDISGDYDVQWAAIGPYGGLQFIRDGEVKLTFQCGSVGWSTGIAGGRGSWN